MSPSGCQLSQLTQLTTPSSPASTQPPNFPFPGLSRVVFSFSEGEHPPPTAHGAPSAAWSCQHCHLGTVPAGLAGARSGQFESAVMESS